MILSNKGAVEIKGRYSELRADFAVITASLLINACDEHREELMNDLIDIVRDSYQYALATNDENKVETDEGFDEFIDNFAEELLKRATKAEKEDEE